MSKRVDYKDEYYDLYGEGDELISYPQYKNLVKDFKVKKVVKPVDKKKKEKEREVDL